MRLMRDVHDMTDTVNMHNRRRSGSKRRKCQLTGFQIRNNAFRVR
ncbi:hypothetical protein AA0473_2284 [Acetobacter orleanensis NRIC 0473]|nr:hypothetical protein AA0473_2284 [Acetobacter orleanensis NRIC 0473]